MINEMTRETRELINRLAEEASSIEVGYEHLIEITKEMETSYLNCECDCAELRKSFVDMLFEKLFVLDNIKTECMVDTYRTVVRKYVEVAYNLFVYSSKSAKDAYREMIKQLEIETPKIKDLLAVSSKVELHLGVMKERATL